MLNPKQQRFVAEYLKDLNATQAAIRSGYSPKTAHVQGTKLVKNPRLAKAIGDGKAKQLDKAGVTAQKVLDRMAQLAFSDQRKLFDEFGNLRAIKDLDDDAAACIASFEIIKKNAAAGDGVVDVVHKVKTVDVTKPLEMLAKHFGLLIERIDSTVKMEIVVRAPWDLPVDSQK